MTISRDQIRPVALPREIVAAPAVGGDVIVQGLDLPGLLEYRALVRQVGKPADGEDAGAAAERAAAATVPWLLARCVLADDGLPVYTAEQWAAFAVAHMAEAGTLFAAASRLSGQGDDEKKA